MFLMNQNLQTAALISVFLQESPSMISARLHTTQLNGNQSLLPVTFLRSQEGEGRKKIKVELGCIMLATKGNAYRELKSEVSQGKYLYHKLD